MKIRVTNGMNRRDVELPMSDSELSLHMKQIGVDESIPKCKLIEVWDKGNPLAPFIGYKCQAKNAFSVYFRYSISVI